MNVAPAGRTSRSVSEHLAIVLDLAATQPLRTKDTPLADCLNRVLARDVCAERDIPRFAQSAMDGFAVNSPDLMPGVRLPVSAQVMAGDSPEPLAPGTAARIMTGAAVPPGADTVVPFEQADADEGTFAPTAPVTPGANIRHPGEDVSAGFVVLRAGTRLTPRHIGAAAALGLAVVPVVRRPRVAIITTGDELCPAGRTPGPAQIPDSNGPYLVAALTQAGAKVTACRHSRDDNATFESALAAVGKPDLLVVTGGASMGDKDVARDVLGESGVDFVSVRMQPGKPQGAGRWNGLPVLALPGNPVSVAVSFAVFVRPLLEAMLGATREEPRWGVVEQGWTSVTKRQQYYPVRVTADNSGMLRLAPATQGGSGSHLVTSLAKAQAFAVVPEEAEKVAPGDVLQLIRVN